MAALALPAGHLSASQHLRALHSATVANVVSTHPPLYVLHHGRAVDAVRRATSADTLAATPSAGVDKATAARDYPGLWGAGALPP